MNIFKIDTIILNTITDEQRMKSAIMAQIDLCKRCRPRSEVAKGNFCPGPSLPVIHTTVSQTHIQVI